MELERAVAHAPAGREGDDADQHERREVRIHLDDIHEPVELAENSQWNVPRKPQVGLIISSGSTGRNGSPLRTNSTSGGTGLRLRTISQRAAAATLA